jgi:hypothetical protein
MTTNPQPQRTLYYAFQFDAIGAAVDAVEARGWQVTFPEDFLHARLANETGTTYRLPCVKRGTAQERTLVIEVYRMKTGRYEQNHYIA